MNLYVSIFYIVIFAINFFVFKELWKKQIRGKLFVIIIILYVLIPILISIFEPSILVVFLFIYIIFGIFIILKFNNFYNSKNKILRIVIRTIVVLPLAFSIVFIVLNKFFLKNMADVENTIIITIIVGILINLISSFIWDMIDRNK